MRITADFVTSAAGASGFPGDRLPEIALVGRSNVGKSSLINALARQRIARTSARPGKTRLANIYRIARGNAGPLYLVDLPGYGYARGGRESAREFEELTRAYFGQAGRVRQAGRVGMASSSLPGPPALPALPVLVTAFLLVDARHPGLENDQAAWKWLKDTVGGAAIVATKIDKLARGQRIRAMRELESAFEVPVLPCSAVTGEGLDDLWNLIERLTNSRNPQTRRSRNNSSRPLPSSPPRATALRPPKN